MSWRDDWRISSVKELFLALFVLGFILLIAVGPLAYVVHTAGSLLGAWGESPPLHEIVLSALFVPYLIYLWRDNPVVRLVFGVLSALAVAAALGWGGWWLVREPARALPRLGSGLVWLGVFLAGAVAAGIAAVLLAEPIRRRRVRALARLARRARESGRARRRGRKLSRRILRHEEPGYEDAVDACPELVEAAREEGPLREDCVAILARYAAPSVELVRLVTGGLTRSGWGETRQAWIRWAEERAGAGEAEDAWQALAREARLRLARAPASVRRRFLDRLRSGPEDPPWSRFGQRFEARTAGLPAEESSRLEEWLETGVDPPVS